MRICAVSVAALALVVAGCGGGDKRLSRADYAKQADSICSEFNTKLRGLARPKNQQELETFVAQAVPLVDQATGKLNALQPPKDEEQTAKAWQKANADVLSALERLRTAAKAKNRAKMQAALRDGNTANQHANDLARTLGMTACAR